MAPTPARISREQAVEAAFVVLDRDGLDGFSMRALGRELGVDAMAVYHHVPNKAALIDLVVDEVWSMAARGGSKRDVAATGRAAEPRWQEIIAAPMRTIRRILLAHPNLAPIVGTRPASTPTVLGLLDHIVGECAGAGLPPASALPLVDCLVAFTVGKVLAEVRQSVGTPAPDQEAIAAGLTPAGFPHIVAALQSGYSWSPDEQFERGLSALIDGWDRG